MSNSTIEYIINSLKEIVIAILLVSTIIITLTLAPNNPTTIQEHFWAVISFLIISISGIKLAKVLGLTR